MSFKKIAQQAKDKYESEVTSAAELSQLRTTTRKDMVDAGIAMLNADVRPLLEEATADLLMTGIELQISEKFDVYNYASDEVLPTLNARCLGPKRQSDGYQFKAEMVFFASNGKTIKVSRASNEYSDTPKVELGAALSEQIGPLAEQAISIAVESYYATLKEHPGWVMNR